MTLKRAKKGEKGNEGGFEEVGGVEYTGGPGDPAGDRAVLAFRDAAAMTGRGLLRGLELAGLAAIGLVMLPVVLVVAAIQLVFGDFE